jgi:hypothetical protein
MVSPVYPGTPASPGVNSVRGLGALGVLEDDWLAIPGGVGMLIVDLVRGKEAVLPPAPISDLVKSG